MLKDTIAGRFILGFPRAAHLALAPIRFVFWLAEGIVVTAAASGIVMAAAWAVGIIPDALVAEFLIELGERAIAILKHIFDALKD